jgi:hypothetical protein
MTRERHVFILRRSFALRSFHRPLKLRDELLAQKRRSTLTRGWAGIPRCALTRFPRHWISSLELLACVQSRSLMVDQSRCDCIR